MTGTHPSWSWRDPGKKGTAGIAQMLPSVRLQTWKHKIKGFVVGSLGTNQQKRDFSLNWPGCQGNRWHAGSTHLHSLVFNPPAGTDEPGAVFLKPPRCTCSSFSSRDLSVYTCSKCPHLKMFFSICSLASRDNSHRGGEWSVFSSSLRVEFACFPSACVGFLPVLSLRLIGAGL